MTVSFSKAIGDGPLGGIGLDRLQVGGRRSSDAEDLTRKSGLLAPLVTRETTQELIRALAYPELALASEEIQVVLGEYLPWVESVKVDARATRELPTCRDPADQIFLELAAAGAAEALITGDRALLDLVSLTSLAILTPAELRDRLR